MQPRPRLVLAGVGVLALLIGGLAVGTRLLGSGNGPEIAVPLFTDATGPSGLDFTWDGELRYAVGGGVAILDCDDDGFPDLFFAGGAGTAALFRNASAAGGALRFERVPEPVADLASVNGAYPLDVDDDGIADLITLRHGENVALRGLGDCRFEQANEGWSLDGGNEPTEAFSATWEAGSRYPTMAFGNYVELTDFDLDQRCRPNVLLRPDSDGGSGPSYGPPLALEPSFCALSMLFSDWSGAGRADLRVSNDRAYYRQSIGQEQLWRIEPGEPPRLYGEADGWARIQLEGMGIASHDLTGDGRPEVYLTSQAASRLQTLAAGATGPTYEDIGLARGVNVNRPFIGPDVDLPSTAWHPEFADVNNDGRMDLFVSKGNVSDQPDFAMADPSNLLLGQADGTFVEAAGDAGIVVFDRGRGAALVDLNLDGRLDLVESFYGAPARIWRNAGSAGVRDGHGAMAAAHWVALRVRQPAPNGNGIGAVVEIRSGDWRQDRELVVGGGHAGGQLGWLHVGLGPATAPEVRIRWPDGELGTWQAVGLDAFSIVDRRSGVSPWPDPR
jgi:enediyne biosynthesis protein E4